MGAFINVIKKDPQVRIKLNDMLDRYKSLIQNVILKELIKTMGTTKTDIDIELKMKISRIKNLEDRLMYNK